MSTEAKKIDRSKFMSVADAAKALGVSKPTAARIVASGKLRSVRLGQRDLIVRADVEAMVAAANALVNEVTK